jgi:glycine/D-amino acid oxidase-like deaminating enzyme
MNESSDHTFYAAMAAPVDPRPALTQDIEADVCVVGGGFAGLWAARALASRGKDVVLLEANRIAGGASGQNGGFVSAGYAAPLSKIIARVGLDHARELYRLSRDGVEIVRAAVATDMRAAEVHPGRLHVLRTNDEFGLSDYAEMLSRDFSHDLELWRKPRVRATLASDRYFQALHETDAFHLNPLYLARLLAAEIEDHGGRIFEGSRVVGADISGLRKSLVTEKGRVRAFNVVLAGNAGVGAAFPWLAQTVLPIRTHVAVTAPLGERLRQAIRYEGAIADTRRAGDYYHLAGDRLLWGGRISARVQPPRRLERLMAKDIARVYPQLKDAPIEYAWSGVMGYAVHLMPQIGMAAPGVWVSSAFGGQGLNTTAMAGELIASAIAEHDDRWRLFVPFGLVWSGGRAGRAIAQVTYWGMQCADWLDEAQSRAAERDDSAISAGLAPGIAAHMARRAKRRFIESSAGRTSIATIHALRRAARTAVQPFIRAGRKIHAGALALGRVLVQIVWFIAGIIGFIARAVGKAMDAIAAAIAMIARAVQRACARFLRRILVPGAIWFWQRSTSLAIRTAKAVAAFSVRFWRQAVLPAGARMGAQGKKALEAGRKQSIAFWQWSAKQPGIVWNRALIPAAKSAADKSRAIRREWNEARKKRVEQKRVTAESETAEETPSAARATAGQADESSNGEKQKKKKKKTTEKKDSVEA